MNAHFQNGKAERQIRTLQDLARTMLIEAMSKWPQAVSPSLWPYAIRTAQHHMNNTPSMGLQDRKTPYEAVAQTPGERHTADAAPFGCPVYPTVNEVALSQPYNKWHTRSKRGIHLGPSPLHSRRTILVLDPSTGLVSPQFNAKPDRTFTSVTPGKGHTQWKYLAGLMHPSQWATPPAPRATTGSQSGRIPPRRRQRTKVMPPKTQEMPPAKHDGAKPPGASLTSTETERPAGNGTPASRHPRDDVREPKRKRRKREDPRPHQRRQIHTEAWPAKVKESPTGITAEETIPIEVMESQMQTVNGLADTIHLNLFKATTDPDILYYHQAMKARDGEQFRRAVKAELRQLGDTGTYTLIRRKSLPPGTRLLPMVWQLKRKRDLMTGRVKKYKARLNIDGSRMEKGVDYTESYAPVTSWETVRLLLTMSLIHGWHSRQVDYVGAYPQAPIERPTYTKVPPGMPCPGNPSEYALHIHSNLYGQRQAGKVWHDFLIQKLLSIGYVQSEHDPCVLFKGRLIYLLYTDDTLLFGPDKREIDNEIANIKKTGLRLTDEGDVADFLGVRVKRDPDGTIHLDQHLLAESICRDLHLGDAKSEPETPSDPKNVLGDGNGRAAHDRHFNYRSVVGKLLYIEKSTRPDLAYSVHQCARYSAEPRVNHARALKRIARYVKATMRQGLRMKPDPKRDMELYVDADFAGGWTQKTSGDPRSALSRHGFVLMYKGCPIIWKSQLQTTIAMSTTEAEYIGLSSAIRSCIPLMRLVREISERIDTVPDPPKVICTVHEDNTSAIRMAESPKVTIRTKHLSTKYHHFKKYVKDKAIVIRHISTQDQLADIFTKPLPPGTFLNLRSRLLGW